MFYNQHVDDIQHFNIAQKALIEVIRLRAPAGERIAMLWYRLWLAV